MLDRRIRAVLLASVLGAFGPVAALAAEIQQVESSDQACEAQTWPNISPACAAASPGKAAPRQVRVISLDSGSPATVPLPASVRAEYASTTSPRNPPTAPSADRAPALTAPSGTDTAAEQPRDDAPDVAATVPADADVKAAAAAEKRARIAARKRERHLAARERRAAEARYDAALPLRQDGYGRPQARSGLRYGSNEPPQQGFNLFGGF